SEGGSSGGNAGNEEDVICRRDEIPRFRARSPARAPGLVSTGSGAKFGPDPCLPEGLRQFGGLLEVQVLFGSEGRECPWHMGERAFRGDDLIPLQTRVVTIREVLLEAIHTATLGVEKEKPVEIQGDVPFQP